MTLHLTLNRRQFLAGSALLRPPVITRAQGTPIPPQDTALSTAIRLDRLPGKRVIAYFVRFSFAPGGEAPMFDRVGSALVMVESGILALASDGPVTIRRSRETGPVAQEDVPADGVDLGRGDAALIGHGQQMGVSNVNGDPSALLMLVAYAPYREFSYLSPAALPGASGVTSSVIGYGAGGFAEAPAILLLEKDVVRPGGSDYSSTLHGIEIGGIASGSARATFRSGANWTSRGALKRAGTPIRPGDAEIEAGETVDLGTSDGYVSRAGSITWRATGDGPLVVLRAQLVPIPQPR